eukprot:11429037-Ditylum_brightwellii.AAC.1
MMLLQKQNPSYNSWNNYDYLDHLWDMRHNTTTYNTAIAALAKCSDVRRAEQILHAIKAMQYSSDI